MLSCSCGWDYEYYYIPDDFFSKLETSRRKRCASCKELINIGEDSLKLFYYRIPFSEIEERIYDDEVPLANKYFCEKCGEIFLNLEALGYCLSISTPMQEYLEEYWELTGFKPK